jgi:hypothetical protein
MTFCMWCSSQNLPWLGAVAPGDIVFLGSDGVADNFDPIILKIARAAPYASEVGG